MRPEAPLRIPRAADVVADHLRRQIIRGELAEGRTLPPEEQLLERFGVSAPTLRAAYRVLENEGLISVHRGARGGATVHRPTTAAATRHIGGLLQAEEVRLVDLFGARVILEPPLARAVATNPGADVLDQLRACLADEEAVLDDAAEFAAATNRFHATLVQRSGNRTVALLLGLLWDLFEQHALDAMAAGPGTDRRLRRRALAAHAKLTELIAAADADGAEIYWRQHMGAVASMFARRYGTAAVYELLG